MLLALQSARAIFKGAETSAAAAAAAAASQGAEQAASEGQGSIEKAEGKKVGSNPFFTFVHVDDNVCAARGRGGGLALWSKIANQPST